MSDKILRALMRLFAIVANSGDNDNGIDSAPVTGGESGSRDVVKLFLKQQLSQNLVDKYVLVFDEYLGGQTTEGHSEKQAKRISVSSVKVLKICTEINRELNSRQKYIVLMRLLEFIAASGKKNSTQSLEFAQTVSEVFNISPADYKACLELVFDAGNKTTSDSHADHLHFPSLDGALKMSFMKEAGIFFFRYNGEEQLTLNGQPFSSKNVQVLAQGSVIRGTKTEAIYYSDVLGRFIEQPAQQRIRFDVQNLEYKFRSGRIGLHSMNFSASSGSMVAIMGGSGAGKSTLLNVLNGINDPTSGTVLVNGMNLHKEKKKTENIIGFIPQDDLLIEELTVFQNLFYSSKLCFAGLDDEAITKKVDTVLDQLGLSEVKDMKVGGVLDKTISGGQRKRLNIALEIIREPSILFVDEPTSGLSSKDSENVMDLLKQLALTGKLVMVVIHQPSSDIFKLFDRLLLLDVGGYLTYYGDPSDSLIYFKRLAEYADAEQSECITCGNINPEQIFSILEAKVLDEYGNVQHERKTSPKEWNQRFIDSQAIHKETHSINDTKAALPGEHEKIKKPSRLRQFGVYLKRDVLSKISNKQYLLINFLEAPALGLILSFLIRYNKPGTEYVFRDNPNLPAYLFMIVIVALFLGMTVSAEEIFRDRKILKRESFLHLSRSSYLFSKIMIMLVISAIQSLLFLVVGNNIIGVQGMFWDYWLIMFTTSCFANLLGLNISSAFNSAVTIYILIPLLIVPQLLLSGVIVKFDKLNTSVSSQSKVPIVGEVMASRWAFEALAVNQYKNNAYEKHFFDLDKRMSKAGYHTIFWVGRMEDKANFCLDRFKEVKKDKDFVEGIELINHEMQRERDEHLSVFYTLSLDVTPKNFSAGTASLVKDQLKTLKKYYIDQYNKTAEEKDALILQLQGNEADGAEKLKKLKKANTNEALDDLVLNKNDQVQIVESGNHFVQHYQPVYMDGDKDSFLRATFYASQKNIFGQYMDTFWANMGVIWFMIIVLTICLYFDWLKKIVMKITN